MKSPRENILYIELKSGYNDDGPAWIGSVHYSKSGQTIYFNNKGFQQRAGIYSNYIDIETNECYWISGVKKNGQDRHWAGSGKIMIDSKVIEEYLKTTGESSLDTSQFQVIEIVDEFPIERINDFLNKKDKKD